MKWSREVSRKKRHLRQRIKLNGTADRPRLAVRRTARHLYVQVIDDTKGHTVAYATTAKRENTKESRKNCANVQYAKQLGNEIAQKALEKGVKRVVFDRCGGIYKGVYKALADAAREGGLDF